MYCGDEKCKMLCVNGYVKCVFENISVNVLVVMAMFNDQCAMFIVKCIFIWKS